MCVLGGTGHISKLYILGTIKTQANLSNRLYYCLTNWAFRVVLKSAYNFVKASYIYKSYFRGQNTWRVQVTVHFSVKIVD